MRAFLVVFVSPDCDFSSGISQVVEPIGVQAFISEAPVKAFDMPVLRRLSGLNMNQVDLLVG